MIKNIFVALALLILASAPARAESVTYTYDPAHTQVMFSVSHLGFSYSHGRFNKFSGQFMMDEQKPEGSSAEIAIDTGSIDMNSDAWDKHLKSADFFNVEKFPKMAFKSTKIVKTGEKTAEMTGDFTLLGVTKPVTMYVTLNKIGEHPMNKNKMAGFSLTGKIKRSDFGMNYGLPMVGDDVAINVQVEGIRQDFTKLPE